MKHYISYSVLLLTLPFFLFSCSNSKNTKQDFDIDKEGGMKIIVEVAGEDSKTAKKVENILTARLNSFCEERHYTCHVKTMDTPETVLVELPKTAKTDIIRLRKLIQRPGNLEFWETYSYDEVGQYFVQSNDFLANLSDQENPLFELLRQENLHPGSACMGRALEKDTATINRMLRVASESFLFPNDLKLAWTLTPIKYYYDDEQLFELIALRSSIDGKCAMDGENISDAHQEHNQYDKEEVLLKMNSEGAKEWKRLTGENVGRQIAIVIDNYIYSYPVVNGEIPNGQATIWEDNMTVEEAQDLAIILKSGKYPVPVTIVEENEVNP